MLVVLQLKLVMLPITGKCLVFLDLELNKNSTHRAMFKLGGQKLFVLCLLVKNVSAVNSADRCNFKESEKVAQDLNRIGGDISSD